MTLTLAIIFGFMVFLLILNKANYLFISFGAVMLIAALSFGVGYGVAVFLVNVVGPIIKAIAIVLAVLIGFGMLVGVVGKKEE